MRNKHLLLFFAFMLSLCKIQSQPVISSISPASAVAGTMVNITGYRFSVNASSNIVYFGAAKATVITANPQHINVIVPAGATSAPVTVTCNNLTAYSPQIFNVVSTANGSSINNKSFLNVLTLTTGFNPRSVVLGDFDQDGKIDLAVTKQTSTTISIFRNTSSADSISFDTALNFTTGKSPFGIATGDFNGDGALDIVVTNFNSGLQSTVSVLINASSAGKISFKKAVNYSTGNGTIGVAVCDLNKDGKVDFGVCSSNSSQFIIYQNEGSGSGTSFKAERYNYYRTDNMVMGNIDKDGKQELIVSNPVYDKLTVYDNVSSSSQISLQKTTELVTGRYPNALAVMDLNLDGKADVMVGNFSGDSISVYKNLTSSKGILFANQQDVQVGTGPQKFTAADLNGDEKPEIICPNDGSQSISILQNESAHDSIKFDLKIDYTVGYNPTCVVAGDLNGDGKPELIVVNATSGTISIYKNKIRLATPVAYK